MSSLGYTGIITGITIATQNFKWGLSHVCLDLDHALHPVYVKTLAPHFKPTPTHQDAKKQHPKDAKEEGT